jgi:hypothetical protein
MSSIIDLADAITAHINALPELVGQPATRRLYLPTWSVDELAELRIAVVPSAQTITPLDRHCDTFEYRIEVAITQRLDPLETATADALMMLVEEILDAFRPGTLEQYFGLRCIEVQNDPLYDPRLLEAEHVFNSLITLTYGAARERGE